MDEKFDEENSNGKMDVDVDGIAPGALRLGRTAKISADDDDLQHNKRCVYTTRYAIVSSPQPESNVCRSVALEKCVPCVRCRVDAETRPVAWIWYFVASELLLFSLRLLAISFGAIKEVLDMRHSELTEDVHLIFTVVETAVTLGVILIQILNARSGYIKLRHSVESVTCCEAFKSQLTPLRSWMRTLQVAGAVHMALCVGCFVLFYHVSHLGWTLMSNHACVITVTVLAGLYAGRLAATAARIKDDQHKVVIHEALLLLRENCAAADATDVNGDNVRTSSSSSSHTSAQQFIDAVSCTDLFAKPNHIVLSATDRQPCAPAAHLQTAQKQ